MTGLGTPNQMRAYVKSGAAPAFELWNPGDLGYLSIYTLDAIATGKIKGNPGDTFTAGKLGSYTIAKDGTVLLGKPTVFDKYQHRQLRLLTLAAGGWSVIAAICIAANR